MSSSSSLSLLSSIGTQINPPACFTRKLTSSGVDFCAEKIRSPSFSLSSSSTTIIHLPFLKSSTADSIVLNLCVISLVFINRHGVLKRHRQEYSPAIFLENYFFVSVS